MAELMQASKRQRELFIKKSTRVAASYLGVLSKPCEGALRDAGGRKAFL